MGVEEAFTGLKWAIVEELVKHPKSPTELAKIFSTSVANIVYNLKLLSAYGLVDMQKERTLKPGKPRKIYSLAGDQALVMFCSREAVRKRSFKPSWKDKATLNMIFLPEDVRSVVGTLLFSRTDIIDKADAIAFVSSNNNVFNFLVITENLSYFRDKIANINLSAGGKKVKVVFWSHTYAEALEGLKKGEEYFLKHFNYAQIIFDKDNYIKRIKSEVKIH